MAEREIRIPIVGDSSQLKRELDKAQRDLDGFGGNARKIATSFNREFLLLGAGIAAGLGLAIKTAADFDKQISEVGAVSGATADELATLRDQAIKAGAATIFSASQAAEAQAELAKAGVSTADILGGGLTGALDLAAAGNLDLADAATYAAQTMNTFGLNGSDVASIADALAAGANKSAAEIDDMGLALQQSGLVANQFGLSMEETVGVLSLLAQEGLRGSDAGTSLKNAILKLGAPTDQAARSMEELGLNMYDANGQFVGIQDAAQQLQDKLGGLSEEQRNAALQTIFGTDAIRAANALYEAGGAGVKDWTDKVSDAGYASDLAAQKTDNLSGDLEALRGSIETALIQGGSQATDVLRGMTQGLTNVVNGLGAMPGPLQTAFLGAGGLLSVGSLGVGIYGTLAPKIDAVKASLQSMGGIGPAVASNLGTIGLAAGGVTAALGAVSYFYGKAAAEQAAFNAKVEEFTRAMEAAGGATDAFNKKIAEELASTSVGDILGDTNANIDIFVRGVRDAGTELDKFASGEINGKLIDLDAELRKAASGGDELAAEIIRLKDEGQITGDQVTDLVSGLDTMNDTVDTASQKLAVENKFVNGLGTESGDAATEVDGLARSQEGAAAAAEEHARALEQQYTAITTLAGGDVALKQAQIAAREELQTYNDTMADATASADDREKAGLDLIDAFLRESDAAVGLARDQAEAAGETLGASEATDIQRQALEYLRDTLAPGDPLRAQLQGYIDQLNTIPPEKQTEINANTAEAKRRLDEILAKLREVSFGARFEVNGTVYTSAGPGAVNPIPSSLAPARAFGGPVKANTIVPVGEHGRETFIPATDGWVMNGSTPPPMGGGGGTSVVISGPVYIDARDKTGEQILEELMKVAKVNGPLPIPIAA